MRFYMSLTLIGNLIGHQCRFTFVVCVQCIILDHMSTVYCILDICFVTNNSFYNKINHYNDVIMGAIASQITSLPIVFSTVCLDTNKKKYQSSASLAFVRGIHRRPVNSPHKGPVTRKMFPFDDVIMKGTRNIIHERSCVHSSHVIAQPQSV